MSEINYFDELTPGDFDDGSAAPFYSVPRDMLSETFDGFVNHCLMAVAYADGVAAANGTKGKFPPIVVMRNAVEVIMFSATDDDEDLAGYTDRMRDIAKARNVTEVFITFATRARMVSVEVDADTETGEQLGDVSQVGEGVVLEPVVLYYAATINPADGPRRRNGLMKVVKKRLGTPTPGSDDQPNEMFDKILGL